MPAGSVRNTVDHLRGPLTWSDAVLGLRNMTIVSDPADSTHRQPMTALTGFSLRRQRGLSMATEARPRSLSAGGTMTHRQRLSMIVVALLAALGLSFAGAGLASAAPSAPAAAPPVAALATPITGTADNGSFAGSFTPA